MSVIILGILIASIFVVISPVSASRLDVYAGKNGIENGTNLISAILSAKSGDIIRVHAGTYNVTKNITIPHDNIKIIGDDPFKTIIDASGNSGNLITATKNNITIKNLTIKNSAKDALSLGNDSTVSNCIITDNKGYAIYGDLNITIEYCYIENNGLDGIKINRNGKISNVISINNVGSNIRAGEYSTIKNCLTAGSKTNDGISVDNRSSVINCTSSKNYGNGIKFKGRGEIVNCITTDNKISGINGSSEVSVTYSNSWNNKNNYLKVTQGNGCISKDPKFTSKNYSWSKWINGKKIDYFLSNDSPSINSGSATSEILELLNGWSTTIDGTCDTKIVDMGFHFATKC